MVLLPRRLGLGGRRALGVAEATALLAELLGPHLVARPLGLTHGAAERLDLGPEGLIVRLTGPMGHVGGNDRVDLRHFDATTPECGLDPLGIFAQHADIDHACSK